MGLQQLLKKTSLAIEKLSLSVLFSTHPVELCSLVRTWRILQRVESQCWTTDDIVTTVYSAMCYYVLLCAITLATSSNPNPKHRNHNNIYPKNSNFITHIHSFPNSHVLHNRNVGKGGQSFIFFNTHTRLDTFIGMSIKMHSNPCCGISGILFGISCIPMKFSYSFFNHFVHHF